MRVLVALAGIVLVVAGCGAATAASPPRTSSVGSPGVFMTRILREEIHGQWGLQWKALHPAHQKLISEAEYVACSSRMGTDFATGDEVFRVLDVRTEKIEVRGVPERVSKLVTVTFHHPGKQNGLTYRMHAVNVKGHWAWILGDKFLSALARGRCLDGSPLRASA
jgi:hypothetical protein